MKVNWTSYRQSLPYILRIAENPIISFAKKPRTQITSSPTSCHPWWTHRLRSRGRDISSKGGEMLTARTKNNPFRKSVPGTMHVMRSYRVYLAHTYLSLQPPAPTGTKARSLHARSPDGMFNAWNCEMTRKPPIRRSCALLLELITLELINVHI